MTCKLTKSVTFHRQEDAAILSKLRRAGKFDRGSWSPFVRELIRQWAEGGPANGNNSVAAVDIGRAIAQALDDRRLDLASIRQTLESTIGSVTPVPTVIAAETEATGSDWFDTLEEEAIL